MAKLKTFRVSHSVFYKGWEIVNGQSYKTVARRFWGDNLKFNVMHEGDVQVLKKARGIDKYYLVGSITEIDPELDKKYTESQAWMKDLKREYRKVGGRRNFRRY